MYDKYFLCCEMCHKNFEVLPHKVSQRKFCSKHCSVEAQHGKTTLTDPGIQALAHSFALENSEKIFSVKLNKLKQLFQPLWDSIAKEYKILDIRTISKIVVGKPCSRKDFLYYLRSYVQNVRGTTANQEAVELGDKKPLG